MPPPPKSVSSGEPSPPSADHADSPESIEADLDASDSVEGYESDSDSAASTSLASSVRDYVFENNRRYHKFKEGRYLIPNDDIEQEREDMKHTMCLHVANNNLHFAPLDHPQKILDLGTGTGIWAIDMGDEYPSAEIIGVDLSPIQPSFVPPNVKFYVDDVESEWIDKPESIDFIHARHMAPAIKNWPELLQQAYRTLRPGAWIELQELKLKPSCDDGTMPDDYLVADFMSNLAKGFSCFGVDLLGMERNQQLLIDAGFVNVEEKIFKVPIGAWARDQKWKTIGMYNRSVIADALQGVAMGPYSRGLKWTPEEIEKYLIGVRRSLANTSIHSYYTFHVVYGQKPTTG
ncbi:hypothetical protein V2G26_018852 [Clonostachys chloroleuca]|uniref:Secondary metabolism regulator LAE1 n=1 Tax=Clonostachys chloroleuca TaxID=1926264 RepID=A0AA35LWL5_9HYPO|nr:unnamed protein product [Clonostachys chloroleuca]